jgi:hypothetical protein
MMTNAVDAGADANILLFNGIRSRQLPWVQRAVERGADISSSMKGLSYGDVLSSSQSYPVFFWLARSLDAAVGDYLLSKGADIDGVSSSGDTALQAAVRMRD